MGDSSPILSVKRSVTVDAMLNFDGDGHGDGMCKQTFRKALNVIVAIFFNLRIWKLEISFVQCKHYLGFPRTERRREFAFSQCEQALW